MQATKENIGQIMYPIDNSYLMCITTEGKGERLAGVFGVEALPCKIVSAPYNDNLEKRHPAFDENRSDIHEFIDVEYNGDIYSILNFFHESYESMIKSKQDRASEYHYYL